MADNPSVNFFDRQFRACHAGAALELNPFEQAVLEWLPRGELLEFGCGLGNLALAAARRGCRVLALDASPAAVEHLRERAREEALPVDARLADLRSHPIGRDFDAVVSIGLLMFFDCPTAARVLAELQAQVRPGGLCAINVLIRGTTFMDMFDPAAHCLFEPGELERRFAGWEIVLARTDEFAAPRATLKRFSTVVARRPAPLPPAARGGPRP